MSAPEEPKIIIDTDWKSQAQAEKERLAKKSEAAKKPAGPANATGTTAPGAKPAAGGKPASAADPSGGPDDAPQELGFQDLVGLLATQTLQYLGYFGDPQTGQAMVSIEYAKLHLDLLGILETKTKGNLAPEESQYLAKTLSQLRMEFVEVSKAVAKAIQEGRIKPGGPGGAIGVGGPAGGGGLMAPGGPGFPPGT